ncbi:MAG: hypothetical protein M0P01_07325 [Treponema sp.]|nr:hypothetical protein [Treponema sp.]
MTSGQKIAVSLLTTVVIFAGFSIAAFAGLFSQIEARFYEPAKVAGIRKQLNTVSESSETYIKTLLDRFGTGSVSYIRNKAVFSYLSPAPADTDVLQRTKATGTLFSETPGLDGIRLIDANGRNVHFSTYSSDILKQTDTLRMYKNYDEFKSPSGENEFPYESVSVPDTLTSSTEKYRITYDGKNSRLIFSFPFYDSYSVYRGSMLFYVNAQDFDRTLVMQNLISINNSCVLISTSDGKTGGFVFGIPNVGRELIESGILHNWESSSSGPDKIISEDGTGGNSTGLILISGTKNEFVRISGVYSSASFMMPQSVQILLLVCVFITSFLIIFMIFSLRRDDIVIIRDRIKRLQFALINEYLENKETIDWNDVLRKIAGRREDVSTEIQKSLGFRAKRHAAETDALITRSWDEIINALSSRTGNILTAPDKASRQNTPEDQQEIRRMLEEILRNGSIKVQAVAAPVPVRNRPSVIKHEAEAVEDAEPLEEIPEAETADEAEELEEIPEAEPVEDAELLEEVPEAEPVEDAELLEEVPEAAPEEDAEPVEEVPEAEPVEDAEPVEEVPEAEPVEDAEPVEEVPEAEPVEDAETVDVDEFIKSENTQNMQAFSEDSVPEILQFGEPVRKTYHPDEEDNAIKNFDIVPHPDFSGLDESLTEKKADDTRNSDLPVSDEDISLESFGVTDKTIVPEELHEIPAFSSINPTENEENSDDAPDFNLEPEMPVFSELDKTEDIDTPSIEEEESDSVPDDVRPLTGENEVEPFGFTRFGANNDNIYDLTPVPGEVIVEDNNGLFSISPDIAYTDIVQNPVFKKLVDSVLH